MTLKSLSKLLRMPLKGLLSQLLSIEIQSQRTQDFIKAFEERAKHKVDMVELPPTQLSV